MITPANALQLVLNETEVLPPTYYQLNKAIGLCLETEIKADRPYPAFNKSLRDGFAVYVRNAGHTIPIIGECAPGKKPELLNSDSALSIYTGAPCPDGCEAVVKIEDCTINPDHTVSLPAIIIPGQNIEKSSSIIIDNQILIEKGSVLTPQTAAVAASCGITQLKSIRRPVIAVIITGDEIVKYGKTPSQWEIRDSNSVLITSTLEMMGIKDVSVHYCRDNPRDYDTLLDSIEADVVIISGAVSMGKYDIVPKILENAGVRKIFHRITQKPGRPMYFGKLNKTLFFGLPGNPAAVKMCTDRYICPAIQKMMGLPVHTSNIKAILESPISVSGNRTSFLSGILSFDNKVLFKPLLDKGSADIFSTINSNSYCVLEGGDYELDAGSEVSVYVPPYIPMSSVFAKPE
ncbi:molybdopterin molybdotransferase MoeA [Myxococcota bacterium]|nr:molybdopterin molybdotransferase MoeA [Myxococcota bacterium]MBU1382351.1 molybdopterin molybdotransferase MoeA [Myxococcota bacterium]MBU1498688.1 molybdopterin molybdotransferase MoeA [Myxococcota bacterium]